MVVQEQWVHHVQEKFDEHNGHVDDDAGGVDADAAGDTDVFVFVFHRW